MNVPDPIWVGVDGSQGSAAAVRYASQAAVTLDVGVHLVYAIPLNVAMSPMFPLVPEEMEAVGRKLLEDAAGTAAEILAPARVTSSLQHGPRARVLVEASEKARFLVLGRAHRSTAERLLTGSVATSVSAHTSGTVVVVPAGWARRDEQFHVVVGIKDVEHSVGLALRAMQLAAERGGRVTFVHVWDLPSPYADLSSAQVPDQGWAQRDQRAISALLGDVKALHPGVPVDVRVVRGQPAWALQQESSSADLLLLARRQHVFPRGHLGGTARALLRESSCPVEVVPPAAETAPPADLLLEGAGAVQR
jgi:nucleotide-binding universal stress UspA family protein